MAVKGTDSVEQAEHPATVTCGAALARFPANVIEEISPRDHMYNSDPEAYFPLARLGLDCTRRAMVAAGRDDAHQILVLPSGHGRVLRMLKAEFPDAKLTACDIDRDAVDFCARVFGATPLYGQSRPANVEVEGQYDLVWCASLLTHLDKAGWSEFLDFFESVLLPDGLLLFTTHGREIAKRLRDREERYHYLRTDEQADSALAGFEQDGFGYADYELQEDFRESLSLPADYGVSLSQPSWVCRELEKRPKLRMVTFMEGEWGAQDVVGCVRVADDRSAVSR